MKNNGICIHWDRCAEHCIECNIYKTKDCPLLEENIDCKENIANNNCYGTCRRFISRGYTPEELIKKIRE